MYNLIQVHSYMPDWAELFFAAKSDGECSPKADNKECGPRKHCVKTADNNKYHCVCKPGYVANGDSCKGKIAIEKGARAYVSTFAFSQTP